ncbi:MAG: Transcriptional regulator superfamily [candidate division WWE3 bacterium CSP1-7]|uniref:Transcriptional regulator superfamily n=1 Tax=candidate division WWE3 bacterium CSP1-7 TaxID=1576480 RepID=A0A0T5ZXW3_UNCKA|nr:MAG: Transcriptional regulator superfamily [candidate division WWE3 bacterium CSP1-7]HJZ04467.1 Rrf2 family transcriptional regulator [Patescibacteria group bacterium]
MPRLLTSRGDYGILLMASLAKDLDKKPHSLSEIAASCRLPLTFLEQIAFDLKKSQLLTAQRGRHGGYLLTRRPEMISLVEILEVLEGPLQTVPCQDSQCSLSDCATRGFWEVLQRHLHKTLQRVTLADLISGNPHKLIPV